MDNNNPYSESKWSLTGRQQRPTYVSINITTQLLGYDAFTCHAF